MKRYAMSPRGKKFELTDEMIALRDAIAKGLGFVKRQCSLCDEGKERPCWETPALDSEFRGRMIASYHCAPKSLPDVNGDVWFHWPEKAEIAAFAIDKGKK